MFAGRNYPQSYAQLIHRVPNEAVFSLLVVKERNLNFVKELKHMGVSLHKKPVVDSVQFVAQAKILRVIQMIQYMSSPRTLTDIADHFDINHRTAHRYTRLISECGFHVDKKVVGWNKVYFSISVDTCPLCGSEHKSPENKEQDVHTIIHSQPGFF